MSFETNGGKNEMCSADSTLFVCVGAFSVSVL